MAQCYLLYVNDIINASNILFPILFADDTNVFQNGKKADILIDTMNSELQELVNWLCSNKLSLNVVKTIGSSNFLKNVYCKH